jgi:hypothetical protein
VYIDYELLVELDLADYYSHIEQTRLKSYWLNKHICTDTIVGTLFYFLDDEFVGYSTKPYRKSSTHYYWLNKESYTKTKEYVISLLDEDVIEKINTIDLDEEFDEFYRLGYCNELLNIHYDNAYWNDEKVQILKLEKDKIVNRKVKINVIERNTNFWCDISELKFKQHIK